MIHLVNWHCSFTCDTRMKRINGERKITRHHLVPRGTRVQSD
jgi:hypothetical protein